MNGMNGMVPFGDGFGLGYGPLWGAGILDPLFGSLENRMGFRAEVKQEEGRYIVRAEVPGIDPETICVSVEKGILTLAATQDGEGSHRHMHRSYHLEGIDEEAVTAQCRHGVLTITLPKLGEKEGAKPRRIEIT